MKYCIVNVTPEGFGVNSSNNTTAKIFWQQLQLHEWGVFGINPSLQRRFYPEFSRAPDLELAIFCSYL
jgi:hypothetical protein